ncbi:MFS transporter [Rhodococcus sp. NPDC058521]|uniref:MFS transporter n=1 Tax=Rhodococcus sp. NPDC058521 TaxID=3346536 RepID=UPI003659B9EA
MTTSIESPGAPSLEIESGGSRFLFPILCGAAIFYAVMQTVIIPLLPVLPGLTNSSQVAVSWMVTITLLVGAVITPIFGRLADMFGKKRLLLTAFVMMTFGSLLCAVSSDIAVLIGARALQGAGAAVIPIGVSLLRDELPPHRVNSAIAMMSSTLGFGTALGLPFSAAIAEFYNWHMLFIVTTLIGVVLTIATVVFVRESPIGASGRFDGAGSVGLAAALVCLLVPITQGGTWGWTSSAVLSTFAASAVLFALWGVHQWRRESPLVDLRVSMRRAVLIPNVVALLVGFAFFGNTLITTQLLQTPSDGAGYGLTIVQAALCQLPTSAAMIIFAQVGVRITERFGSKVTMMCGAVVLTGGYIVHAMGGKDLWLVITTLGVTAIGTALVYSTLSILIVRAVPVEMMAAANGVNVLLRTVGSTVCSAVVATILAAHLVAGTHFSTESGFTGAYLVCALLSVIVLIACVALPGRNTQMKKVCA